MAAKDEGAGAELPGVGDGRQKHVTVLTESNERVEHGDCYLRYTDDAFLVADDPQFEDVTTYEKTETRRLEVRQHHSTCFITTATAGEGPTLDELRGFREDALRPTPAGRALVGVYERVSPPIARTLERHPDAGTTRGVRWLVERCATLARRRRRAAAPQRTLLTLLLTALYVVGVCWALLGHAALRARELTR
ncbi:CFI-box-CTERM domain-containing protein [Halospeciosus flavus]|uniref:CFI-box-CTERM domain-containing protein n=1 Tax=Halospeciosus flavus TaxID=3032283 RepID=A0ABD5Z936_9EURY|nr:CFI-box-CTERM domain-containing protein [Halospeciosus flavus]